MLSSSIEYTDAIASTDREIRGYLEFSNGFILRGSGGLISVKTTETAMDEERFCVGSTTSSSCEVSFYNEGLEGSGVSLANASFDAYVGVVIGEYSPDPDTDLVTTTAVNWQQTTVTTGGKALPLSAYDELPEGAEITLIMNADEYHGVVVGQGFAKSVEFDEVGAPTLSTQMGLPPLWVLYALTDGVYDVQIISQYNAVEYKCLGRYYVTEITRGAATTKVVGYDVAGRLSMDYIPTVTKDPDNGYLVMDILNDIIDQTGVNNGEHFTMTGDSLYVDSIYEGNCRAQWGWLMTICNDTKVQEFSASRDAAANELGYMKAYTVGNETSAYAMDDTVVYLDGLSIGDPFTVESFTTGTTENPIVAGNGVGLAGMNPYITQAQAESIEDSIDGYTYIPMTLRWRGDPCLELMDTISVTVNNETHQSVVMKIVTTFNGGLEQSITSWGDSEAYYELSTSPTDTKIATVSNLIKEIAQSIETADGGVITKILDTDGTWKELVIANNQDLDQATSVWRWNINGLAHSTSYTGGTYSFALDDQGRMIANIIQTGVLQDAQGDNSWNLDTGAFVITKGSINITTASDTDDLIQLNADIAPYGGFDGGTVATIMQPTQFQLERDMEANGGSYHKISGFYARSPYGAPEMQFYSKSDNNGVVVGEYITISTATGIQFSQTGHQVAHYNADGTISLYDGTGTRRIYLDGSNGRIYPLGSSDYIYDFVIERSTSGSWNWRRWNSGLQEVWHTGSFSRTTSQWTAWGNQYVASATAAQTFPTGVTWTSVPREWATLHSSEGSGWLTNQGTETTTTASQRYEITRPNKPSATVQFYIHYYFQGFWK